MDIRKEILREYGKPQALMIANYIGKDKEKFSQLIELFLATEYRVTQRAAWIVSHCCDRYPELIIPHLEEIIANLNQDPPVAVKRNTLRILQSVPIPENLMGELAEHCFKYLNSNKEPVAVKVFSMTVLANITQCHPDLKEELRLSIEFQMPFGSAGFLSRSKKVLKKLEKI